MSGRGRGVRATEWPTLAMTLACYGAWALGTTWLAALWLPLGFGVTMIALALHSSLQHEMLHGHPFGRRWLNEALVFPALGLFIPYQRFRATHLAHHRDTTLTDPYDDPESNYLDPAVWARLSGPVRRILLFNNTLLGRMLLGPLISQISFLRADTRLIRAGDRAVLRGWILHLIGVGPPVWWLVQVGALPVWAYLAAAYGALSLLKIRTFLEHRADRRCGARTVIVEDKGPLALLFLNNNLHLVHHRQPKAAWYRLPALYDADKEHHLGCNGHYLYRSYRQIFARHLLRRKDPVPHPLWKG